jgi:hypothetical protein
MLFGRIDNKTKIHLSIAQSEVSNGFGMLVPIFADFGKAFVRLGQMPLGGQRHQDLRFRSPGRA